MGGKHSQQNFDDESVDQFPIHNISFAIYGTDHLAGYLASLFTQRPLFFITKYSEQIFYKTLTNEQTFDPSLSTDAYTAMKYTYHGSLDNNGIQYQQNENNDNNHDHDDDDGYAEAQLSSDYLVLCGKHTREPFLTSLNADPDIVKQKYYRGYPVFQPLSKNPSRLIFNIETIQPSTTKPSTFTTNDLTSDRLIQSQALLQAIPCTTILLDVTKCDEITFFHQLCSNIRYMINMGVIYPILNKNVHIFAFGCEKVDSIVISEQQLRSIYTSYDLPEDNLIYHPIMMEHSYQEGVPEQSLRHYSSSQTPSQPIPVGPWIEEFVQQVFKPLQQILLDEIITIIHSYQHYLEMKKRIENVQYLTLRHSLLYSLNVRYTRCGWKDYLYTEHCNQQILKKAQQFVQSIYKRPLLLDVDIYHLFNNQEQVINQTSSSSSPLLMNDMIQTNFKSLKKAVDIIIQSAPLFRRYDIAYKILFAIGFQFPSDDVSAIETGNGEKQNNNGNDSNNNNNDLPANNDINNNLVPPIQDINSNLVPPIQDNSNIPTNNVLPQPSDHYLNKPNVHRAPDCWDMPLPTGPPIPQDEDYNPADDYKRPNKDCKPPSTKKKIRNNKDLIKKFLKPKADRPKEYQEITPEMNDVLTMLDINFFQSTFESFCLVPQWSSGKQIESTITKSISEILGKNAFGNEKTISTITASPPINNTTTPSTILLSPIPKNIDSPFFQVINQSIEPYVNDETLPSMIQINTNFVFPQFEFGRSQTLSRSVHFPYRYLFGLMILDFASMKIPTNKFNRTFWSQSQEQTVHVVNNPILTNINLAEALTPNWNINDQFSKQTNITLSSEQKLFNSRYLFNTDQTFLSNIGLKFQTISNPTQWEDHVFSKHFGDIVTYLHSPIITLCIIPEECPWYDPTNEILYRDDSDPKPREILIPVEEPTKLEEFQNIMYFVNNNWNQFINGIAVPNGQIQQNWHCFFIKLSRLKEVLDKIQIYSLQQRFKIIQQSKG